MKFECDRSKIEYLTQKVAKLSNKHLTLPVLSCVFLEVYENNKLVMKSTNLDIGIESELKIKSFEKGCIAVPANILLNFLLSIRDEKLIFETKDNNLKITSNKSSVTIKCMPHEDFPIIPKLDAGSKSVRINIKDLILGFRSVWYSASNSNIKPELSSVYVFKNDNILFFVSTDSFRLAEKKINIKSDIDFPPTLIPFKNATEIMKIFEDYQGDLGVIFEKNQVAFVSDNIYLVSRLIDGSFPDYKQIIPVTFSATATVLKDDLLNSIKISNIFSDSLSQVKLKVDIKNKTLKVESKNNDIGDSKESINAVVSGDDIELNFNSRYITDCLQSISSDSLVLSFGGIGKPLLISGASDKSFLYIVMPMNR